MSPNRKRSGHSDTTALVTSPLKVIDPIFSLTYNPPFPSLAFLLPGEAEITNFENTVWVDEKVAGLDVPVDDLAGVQVLHPPEYLVEEDLDVVRGQVLGGDDDLVQVRLHQLRDEVDFLEKVNVRRLKRGEISKTESSKASSSLNAINIIWTTKTAVWGSSWIRAERLFANKGGGWRQIR